MKKKTATRKPAVEAAQLDALRRLARAGNHGEALRRLDVLKARHPDFKPLYGLARELASQARNPHQSVERAWDWSGASPNSQSAWQALSEDAFAGGYFALGLFARERLAVLTGGASEPPEDIDTPFGKMQFDEALANDQARMFMAVGRFERALTVLEGFDHVSLRNNAALIRFHQGDVAGALAAFEENWQREPRNLFSLEHLIRLRLWTRGRDAAAGLAARLKASQAERSDDALAKLHALLMLGDWPGADAAWRGSADADFWQGPQEIDKSGLFDFAGGVAALRLGDLEAMSERLGHAADKLPARRDLVKLMEFDTLAPELGEAPDIALGEANHWFPQRWIDRLGELGAKRGKAAEDHYDTLQRECAAHPDYLGLVAELGGEAGRFLAISILKRRAVAGDATAKQALIGLLARPCGPDKVRTVLHAELVEEGLLPEGGTVSMRVQGKVREIRHMAMKIHAEPSPPDLPPESHARLERMFDLMAGNRLDECLAILADLIERHPDQPSLYNNLASIKEGLRHPDGEIESLLEKAHGLDPDYLFAIAGLARIAARRGDVERAKDMIEPLLGRPSYHYTEWRSILMTQQAIAQRQGEFGAALGIRRQIEELQERFG